MKYAIFVAVSVGQDNVVSILTCYVLDGLQMEYH